MRRAQVGQMVLFVAAALLAGVSHGAKVVPVTELDALPANEDEAGLWEVAKKHEQRIVDAGEVLDDAPTQAYVKSIVVRMIDHRFASLGVEPSIIIVERPTLSAWVYPYGDIAVTTGLLSGMQNDAQLAAILGHELAHFIGRHSYRELIADKQQSIIGKGLGILATAAVASQTGQVDTSLMGGVGDLWTGLVTSGYSRDLEHVADAEGLELMAGGDFPRTEAIPAFEALRQNDLYGAVNVSAIWSSHPKLDDRIENLREDIAAEAKQKGYQPGIPPDPLGYLRGVGPAIVVNAELDLREYYFERARDELQRYLEAAPDDARAEFLVGESLRKEFPDGPDFALRDAAYQRAVAADASFAQAYRELGMAFRQEGRSDAAIAAFERYLALAPDAPDAGIVRAYTEELMQGESP
jgi:predicted Zn-dependent protease